MKNKIKEQPICEIDRNGTKYWWINYKSHREDGPAIEYPNGDKDWYLNGTLLFLSFSDEIEILVAAKKHKKFIFQQIYLLNKEIKENNS